MKKFTFFAAFFLVFIQLTGQEVTLDLKVFLEGPFNGTDMSTVLNSTGQLPLSQPYFSTPWNYEGSEAVTSIPSSNIVDWVLIDLIKPIGSIENLEFEIVGRKAGFLLNNGFIRNLDGAGFLTVNLYPATDIYICVHHRNHLSIISSQTLLEPGGEFNYDFTDASSKVIGGSKAVKIVSSGIWGMIAADGDASRQIDNLDKNEVWLPQLGQTGYKEGDFNMDSQVNDIDPLKWKVNAGRGFSFIVRHPSIDFNCGEQIRDIRDGQQYNTVEIGDQCWMAENLNVGNLLEGYTGMTDNNVIEKYCFYDSEGYCDEYGGLYQWDEVMQYSVNPGAKGICPSGWHVPTDEEYCTLATAVDPTVVCGAMDWTGIDAGIKLMEAGSVHWLNPIGTNESGFAGLPGGYSDNGAYNFLGFMGHWWTSSTVNGNHPLWMLETNHETVGQWAHPSYYGFSVRCIRNCSPQPTPSSAGPDQLNMPGASVTLQGNVPAEGTGQWSIISGTGGVIADPSNSTSIFKGLAENTYILRWTITNECNTSWDEVTISFAPFSCDNSFLDSRDSKVYNSVQIGTQCWMRENLNIGTMINGAIAPANNSIIEKFCYGNDPDNCDEYGGMYQWNEMMNYSVTSGSQGICPAGWHVPTHEEWCTLEELLGASPYYCNILYSSDGGGDLKETGYDHWESPNTGATNSTGFTALPGGWGGNGWFNLIHSFAALWTSSKENNYYWYRELYSSSSYIIHLPSADDYLYMSLRCINDCVPPTQSDAGPDQLNLPGASATLQGNVPAEGTGQWSVVSGTGGVIADPSNSASIFNGLAENTYTLRWTISNECNTSWDEVTISFAAFSCDNYFMDSRDSMVYTSVQIGEQCWMKENLNIGTRIDVNIGQQDNSIIEKHCYENDLDNCDMYGGLYQWNEMMQYTTNPGVQGICPAGWHVPTDEEWTTLSNFLGGESIAGGSMKTTGTIENSNGLWYNPNTGATNSSGFSALPAGYASVSSGLSYYKGYAGLIWSSTQGGNTSVAWNRKLSTWNTELNRNSDYLKLASMSIRCLKDCAQPTQSNAGPDQLNILGASAILQGNIPAEGTGQWSIISGTNGVIADPSNSTSIFKGLAENTYTLRWTITNECNSSSDEVTISFAEFSCNYSFMDTRDSSIYSSVLIDDQCWMVENLNIGKMIPVSVPQNNNSIIEKFCYNDLSENCETYGGLYMWDEMMQYSHQPGIKGICPINWHLTTYDEWNGLINYLGGTSIAGGALKEAGTVHWTSPNTGATNSSGFTALPGGYAFGFSTNLHDKGFFWSSSNNYAQAWYCRVSYDLASVYLGEKSTSFGHSVRCVRDCMPQPTQSNAGPDQLNMPGASATLQGNVPAEGTGQWSIISGTGGVIADPSNSTSIFNGLAENTYTLRWTITNECNTSWDEVTISFATFSCDNSFMDSRDSMVYTSVQIGSQCWMKQNLNTGSMITGGIDQSDNNIIEKFCYDNSPGNCNIYGGLYQWNEMMQYVTIPGTEGICPAGWHLPANDEWVTLITFLGGPEIAGGKMKEPGTAHWNSPNTGATNESGFTALPGGEWSGVPGFIYQGTWTIFSSSTRIPYDNNYFSAWTLQNTEIFTQPTGELDNSGLSVRCIKNCDLLPTQSNAGPDQLNLTGTSTTLQGNTPTAGSGLWSIISGTGGTISAPSNPASAFSGLPAETYTLRWTISNSCGSSTDDVVISFCPTLTIANAGPDQLNLLGYTTTMQANAPVAGLGIWSVISETGPGYFVDHTNPLSTFLGGYGDIFTLRWTIYTSCDSSYDEVTVSFLTCGGDFIDSRDNNWYSTTEIGTQCWMAKNLNTGTMATQHNNGIIEKSCYDQNSNNCDTYGGLYTWEEMMQYSNTPGIKGICPTGWHLPTGEEWETLITFLGGYDVAGGKMKEEGTTHWNAPNTGATNSSGFTALPGGVYDADGKNYPFLYLHERGSFWSSDSYLSHTFMRYDNGAIGTYSWYIQMASVRCISDCDTPPTQSNAGPDQVDLSGTSATLQGNTPAAGIGQWSIVSGTGGSITNPASPTSAFTGVSGNSYTLRWTINTTCASNYDDVVISFCPSFIPANAGPDQINQSGTSTTLQGNTPAVGSGVWSIISGTGGNIATPSSPTSTFTGVAGNAYTLRWTITTTCGSGYDDVVISFCPTLTIANAGSDQINHSGTSTTLQGNSPGAGTGLWSIISGTGGNITTPSSPTSTFTGLAGNSYTLRWTITTACESSYDDVVISFCPTLTIANAGPDQLNLTYNNPTLQGNTPAAGSGLWSIISGAGGSIANPSSPTSTFTGVAATTYVLQWVISTVCSISSDVVTISFASGWLCGTDMTDTRDDNVYSTVHIGTQCWMQQNMAYLPSVYPPSSGSGTSPRYYVYGYDGNNVTFAKTSNNYTTYGVLYNWPATSNACPSGWHLPSDAEWCTLTTFLDATVICSAIGVSGTNAGGKMKETGTTHWTSPNTGATNSSGFTALGGGLRNTDGTFIVIKSIGGWWSSTSADPFNAWGRSLIYNRADVGRGSLDNSLGYSVRCVKN